MPRTPAWRIVSGCRAMAQGLAIPLRTRERGFLMDTTVAKLITLLCLVALFIAAVLVTPRIWHSNERPKGVETKPGEGSS